MLALAAALSLLPAALRAADAPVQPAVQPDTLSCRSADGQWLLQAHGHSLHLSHASGTPARSWPVADRAGRPGQVLALADHAARRSFIVALQDLPEVWELSYDPQAEPVFDGLVHDYRMGEGLASPGFLGLRRSLLAAPVRGLVVDGRNPWVLVQQASGTAVLHLDVRRIVPQAPAAAVPAAPAPCR